MLLHFKLLLECRNNFNMTYLVTLKLEFASINNYSSSLVSKLLVEYPRDAISGSKPCTTTSVITVLVYPT